MNWDSKDLIELGKGVAVAAAGAALTYSTQYLWGATCGGACGPIWVVLAFAALDGARRAFEKWKDSDRGPTPPSGPSTLSPTPKPSVNGAGHPRLPWGTVAVLLALTWVAGASACGPLPTHVGMTFADKGVHVPLSCAGLTIEGETNVKPYRMVRLKATGAPEGAGFVWEVSPFEKVDFVENGPNLYFVGPPGEYHVLVIAINYDPVLKKTNIARCRVAIKIGDPAPPVPPKPPTPPPTKADPKAATAYLRMGSSGCTATVIYPRRDDGRWDVLTAAHCVRGTRKGTIKLRDGRTLHVSVAKTDTRADLCWMVTDEKPETLPYAILAKKTPESGASVWHNGYGVHVPSNVERGSVINGPDSDGQVQFSLSVSSGDSGGGIFREDTGELVASVCCTRAKGVRASMWGGGCVRAWELRPK